mmetsp:Transcript_16467/g.51497  ORF Transcript_16467/g.51497 Transcript_16467/m.51497 type:complete len:207 (+) Transcript_16467:531-1151(+)
MAMKSVRSSGTFTSSGPSAMNPSGTSASCTTSRSSLPGMPKTSSMRARRTYSSWCCDGLLPEKEMEEITSWKSRASTSGNLAHPMREPVNTLSEPVQWCRSSLSLAETPVPRWAALSSSAVKERRTVAGVRCTSSRRSTKCTIISALYDGLRGPSMHGLKMAEWPVSKTSFSAETREIGEWPWCTTGETSSRPVTTPVRRECSQTR